MSDLLGRLRVLSRAQGKTFVGEMLDEASSEIFRQRAEIERLKADNDGLRRSGADENAAICQTLGKALGYPWFKDDQKNFPGATEEHGVCVGDHVAVTIAHEAANEIERLRQNIGCARDQRTTQYCAEVNAARDRGWNEAIEAAAEKATGFLVGDPAKGIPFRNPMSHEIADAIRQLRRDEE